MMLRMIAFAMALLAQNPAPLPRIDHYVTEEWSKNAEDGSNDLVFVLHDGAKIRRLPYSLVGKALVDFRGYDLMPDGRRLLVYGYPPNLPFDPPGAPEFPEYFRYLYLAEDGPSAAKNWSDEFSDDLSSDGRYRALVNQRWAQMFVERPPVAAELKIQNTRTGKKRTLFEEKYPIGKRALSAVYGPVRGQNLYLWLPRTRLLYYVSVNPRAAYLFDADTGRRTRLTPDPPDGFDIHNGAMLWYDLPSETIRIIKLPRDKQSLRSPAVWRRLRAASPPIKLPPDTWAILLSPDGKRVCVYDEKCIYVRDATENRWRLIGRMAGYPRWSLNSHYVLTADKQGVLAMSADGGVPVDLKHLPPDAAPPPGTYILQPAPDQWVETP